VRKWFTLGEFRPRRGFYIRSVRVYRYMTFNPWNKFAKLVFHTVDLTGWLGTVSTARSRGVVTCNFVSRNLTRITNTMKPGQECMVWLSGGKENNSSRRVILQIEQELNNKLSLVTVGHDSCFHLIDSAHRIYIDCQHACTLHRLSMTVTFYDSNQEWRTPQISNPSLWKRDRVNVCLHMLYFSEEWIHSKHPK